MFALQHRRVKKNMRQVFAKEVYERLKKYVILEGDNINTDRCFCIGYNIGDKYLDGTMCFNDEYNSVCICELYETVNNERLNEITDEQIIEKFINELIRKSEKIVFDDVKKYNFYIEKIEPETSCCELNDDELTQI